MSPTGRSQTVPVYDLVGHAVYDADGKKIGRVQDLIAERRGDTLRVTTLVVGRGGMLDRFGWTKGRHGDEVRWEDVQSLHPKITLRRGARRRKRV
jgi:sporulation protein YlmC with PRC-barrel domain